MIYKLISEKKWHERTEIIFEEELIDEFTEETLENGLKQLISDYQIDEINECSVDEVYNNLLNGYDVDAGVDYTGFENSKELFLSWLLIKQDNKEG